MHIQESMIRISLATLVVAILLHSFALRGARAFVMTQSLRIPYKHSQSRLYQSTDPFSSSDPFVTAVVAAPKQRKKRLKTFTRYLEVECWKRQEFRDLEQVLQAVSDACKQINRIVQRAQTDDLYGVALGPDGKPLEETNVQGEVQQKLDVVCNTIMLRAFCGCSNSIASVASEEEDEPRSCADVMHDNSFSLGNYVAGKNTQHHATPTMPFTCDRLSLYL